MEKSLHVLIIDDSEDDALLLLRELRKNGYEPDHKLVDTPEAMREALAMREWDIILSDFAMPRFSGLAALVMLKESNLDLPFIIVSGKIGEETAVQLMKAGAHDYILKGNLARLAPVIERELQEAGERGKRKKAEEELAGKITQLEAALAKVKQLEGIIPICMYCKKIRDDKESWHQLERYITEHSEALFSHGVCPECHEKAMSEIVQLKREVLSDVS